MIVDAFSAHALPQWRLAGDLLGYLLQAGVPHVLLLFVLLMAGSFALHLLWTVLKAPIALLGLIFGRRAEAEQEDDEDEAEEGPSRPEGRREPQFFAPQEPAAPPPVRGRPVRLVPLRHTAVDEVIERAKADMAAA